MFGFREIKEVKKYEKNLNFDPDARVKKPGKDKEEDYLITTGDNNRPWSPDTRVEWIID